MALNNNVASEAPGETSWYIVGTIFATATYTPAFPVSKSNEDTVNIKTQKMKNIWKKLLFFLFDDDINIL